MAVCAITGASAGVGRAIAREMARKGYDCGVIARGTEGLDHAAQEIRALGRRALACPVDVADADALDAAAGRIEDELGPIEVWINVAFSNVFAEFIDITPAEFRRITEVSYLGFVYGTRSALRRMLERDRGTIVQIGSALSYRSIPLQAGYCGAKSAIRGFTDSIRCELHHRRSNVKITMALLPAVNTPQFSWCRSKLPHRPQPVPPIYQPEVIARAVGKLVDRPRRELVIGFPTLKALAGQIIAPGFADWYLGRTGYRSQQTSEPHQPDAPDNLDAPVAGDFGAHGRFDRRSHNGSKQLWLTLHRGAVTAAVLIVAALAGATELLD